MCTTGQTSTSVLQFINNESKRFHTFVSNRLQKIHNGSAATQWRYVNTKSNPADILSRGESPTQFSRHSVWFSGPEFLWKAMKDWPESPIVPPLSDSDVEVKTSVHGIQVNEVKHTVESCLSVLWPRYSNWQKLQRAVAWLLRFQKLCRTRYVLKQQFIGDSLLHANELNDATNSIIKCVQQEAFGEQINQLLQTSTDATVSALPKRQLRKSNVWKLLQRLSPFLTNGVLRVGGRIQRSALPFNAKHPMILPSQHHVTKLLIEHYHRQEGHCGTNHVLAALRECYWILRGQSTVRSVIRQCVLYRLRFSKPGKQMMTAPLPSCRLTAGHAPFHFTGVDYMGPIYVKGGRSTHKRYICVFTCLSVRAVHLEVSHSLDTSSFMQAFTRFIGRRAKPSEIWSDNGSNFIGAERELRADVQRLDVHNAMLKHNVNWHFNPPAASHQGGIWERIIRSVRKVLCALVGDQVLNDESLYTFIVEVELISNNRPITVLSDDPKDCSPLTPKMILTGTVDPGEPVGVFVKADGYRRSWKLVQYLADQFWSKWLKLYLPLLQRRQKWFSPSRKFTVGDVVLIVGDTCKRGCWPKGVVTEVFPDKEGLVRRVRVRTCNSIMIRDIRKVCLIEGAQ